MLKRVGMTLALAVVGVMTVGTTVASANDRNDSRYAYQNSYQDTYRNRAQQQRMERERKRLRRQELRQNDRNRSYNSGGYGTTGYSNPYGYRNGY
jgi:hypothetical protein